MTFETASTATVVRGEGDEVSADDWLTVILVDCPDVKLFSSAGRPLNGLHYLVTQEKELQHFRNHKLKYIKRKRRSETQKNRLF